MEPLEAALARRIGLQIMSQGRIRLPAVPAMAGRFTERCIAVFAGVGRIFSDEERANLESILLGQLAQAYQASHRSTVTVNFESFPGGTLDYNVTVETHTLEQSYDRWIATREPPLFGARPDARVWALALEAPDPVRCRVLDIGAGTGRNGLALARRGHPVDAVEITESFADGIRADALREGLDVRVIQRDIFDAGSDLRDDYSMVVASEVVPEFRTAAELRRVFELAAGCLTPGGVLVLNLFLADPSYRPDEAARQFAEQVYSNFFTRAELADAVAGLPLDLVADDEVLDYEKAHLGERDWPPTSWYVGWASGADVFGSGLADHPIDLRWQVYRKT